MKARNAFLTTAACVVLAAAIALPSMGTLNAASPDADAVDTAVSTGIGSAASIADVPAMELAPVGSAVPEGGFAPEEDMAPEDDPTTGLLEGEAWQMDPDLLQGTDDGANTIDDPIADIPDEDKGTTREPEFEPATSRGSRATGDDTITVQDNTPIPSRVAPRTIATVTLASGSSQGASLGSAAAYSKGDLDKDGSITQADATALLNSINSLTTLSALDSRIANIDGNDWVNAQDLTYLLRYANSNIAALGFVSTFTAVDAYPLSKVIIYCDGFATTMTSIPSAVGESTTQDGCTLTKLSASEYVLDSGSVGLSLGSGTASVTYEVTAPIPPAATSRAVPTVTAETRYATRDFTTAGLGTTATHVRGDVDRNGLIENADSNLILAYLATGVPNLSGDTLDHKIADCYNEPAGEISVTDSNQVLSYIAGGTNGLGFIATDEVTAGETLVGADVYLNGATTPMSFSSVPASVGDKVVENGFTFEKRSASEYWVYDTDIVSPKQAASGQTTKVVFLYDWHDRPAPDISAQATLRDGSAGGGTAAAYIRGDMDKNGIVNYRDYVAIANIVFGIIPKPSGIDLLIANADADWRGRVNSSDYAMVARYAFGTQDFLGFATADDVATGYELVGVEAYLNDSTTPLEFSNIPSQVGDVVTDRGISIEKCADSSYWVYNSEGWTAFAESGATTQVVFIHDVAPAPITPTGTSLAKMGDNILLLIIAGAAFVLALVCGLLVVVGKKRANGYRD